MKCKIVRTVSQQLSESPSPPSALAGCRRRDPLMGSARARVGRRQESFGSGTARDALSCHGTGSIAGEFAELAAATPRELRYSSLRLADGVTFIHVARRSRAVRAAMPRPTDHPPTAKGEAADDPDQVPLDGSDEWDPWCGW